MLDPLLDFTGKRALVVGGSSGIGNAMAQAFRARGAEVSVWGTRASAAHYDDDATSSLDGLCYAQVDAANDSAVTAAASAFESLDVLILAQGMVLYRRREFDIASFREVVDLNLNSMMCCAMAFNPLLKSSRGSLIMIGSTATFRSTRGNPAYSASKAGLAGLTRTLGDAWARDGVRVNCIAPGMVATKLTETTTSQPKRLAEMIERIPAGRLGSPEEIAGAALFLASPLASYIVGEIIMVDGGLTLA